VKRESKHEDCSHQSESEHGDADNGFKGVGGGQVRRNFFRRRLGGRLFLARSHLHIVSLRKVKIG
jgi:hypothetical protein